MDSTHPRPDDCICSNRRTRTLHEEVAMFQDSLSEGHIYWGRFAIAISAITVLAFLIPHL